MIVVFSIIALNSSNLSAQTVVVYSSHEPEITDPTVAMFTKKTGIKVSLITGGTGELLKRIEAESANPLADVMYGGGVESLDAYKKFFQPFVSSEDKFIPAGFKDKGNLWIGFASLPMVIMYDKRQIKEDEKPKSWNELILPKWKKKIAYAAPDKSGSSYTQLCTILTAYGRGDKAWDLVKKITANEIVLDKSALVFKGVGGGEYPLGITLEDAAYKYIVGGSPIGLIYPSEGTSALPDGVGLIKGAKNLDAAKAFINYVLSAELQKEVIVNRVHRRAVRTDVAPPKGLPAISQIKLVDYDLNWASEQRTELLKKWRSILMEVSQ